MSKLSLLLLFLLFTSIYCKKTQLLMGVSLHLEPEYVYRFIRSFREVNNNADMVFFGDTQELQETLDIYDSYDVIHSLVTIEQLMKLPSGLRRAPWSVRYFLYYEYLSRHKHYNEIIIADVRDMVFQDDPFDIFKRKKSKLIDSLYIFGENASIPIGVCPWNSRWIENCFSPELLDEVRDENFYCSGYTMGTKKPMMEYIKLMIDIMKDLDAEGNVQHDWYKCNDQGIHNILMKDVLPEKYHYSNKVTKHTLENGPVAHCAYLNELRRDKFGYVINSNNQIYKVVHQYDRIPILLSQFSSQYPYLSNKDMYILVNNSNNIDFSKKMKAASRASKSEL